MPIDLNQPFQDIKTGTEYAYLGVSNQLPSLVDSLRNTVVTLKQSIEKLTTSFERDLFYRRSQMIQEVSTVNIERRPIYQTPAVSPVPFGVGLGGVALLAGGGLELALARRFILPIPLPVRAGLLSAGAAAIGTYAAFGRGTNIWAMGEMGMGFPWVPGIARAYMAAHGIGIIPGLTPAEVAYYGQADYYRRLTQIGGGLSQIAAGGLGLLGAGLMWFPRAFGIPELAPLLGRVLPFGVGQALGGILSGALGFGLWGGASLGSAMLWEAGNILQSRGRLVDILTQRGLRMAVLGEGTGQAGYGFSMEERRRLAREILETGFNYGMGPRETTELFSVLTRLGTFDYTTSPQRIREKFKRMLKIYRDLYTQMGLSIEEAVAFIRQAGLDQTTEAEARRFITSASAGAYAGGFSRGFALQMGGMWAQESLRVTGGLTNIGYRIPQITSAYLGAFQTTSPAVRRYVASLGGPEKVAPQLSQGIMRLFGTNLGIAYLAAGMQPGGGFSPEQAVRTAGSGNLPNLSYGERVDIWAKLQSTQGIEMISNPRVVAGFMQFLERIFDAGVARIGRNTPDVRRAVAYQIMINMGADETTARIIAELYAERKLKSAAAEANRNFLLGQLRTQAMPQSPFESLQGWERVKAMWRSGGFMGKIGAIAAGGQLIVHKGGYEIANVLERHFTPYFGVSYRRQGLAQEYSTLGSEWAAQKLMSGQMSFQEVQAVLSRGYQEARENLFKKGVAAPSWGSWAIIGKDYAARYIQSKGEDRFAAERLKRAVAAMIVQKAIVDDDKEFMQWIDSESRAIGIDPVEYIKRRINPKTVAENGIERGAMIEYNRLRTEMTVWGGKNIKAPKEREEAKKYWQMMGLTERQEKGRQIMMRFVMRELPKFKEMDEWYQRMKEERGEIKALEMLRLGQFKSSEEWKKMTENQKAKFLELHGRMVEQTSEYNFIPEMLSLRHKKLPGHVVLEMVHRTLGLDPTRAKEWVKTFRSKVAGDKELREAFQKIFRKSPEELDEEDFFRILLMGSPEAMKLKNVALSKEVMGIGGFDYKSFMRKFKESPIATSIAAGRFVVPEDSEKMEELSKMPAMIGLKGTGTQAGYSGTGGYGYYYDMPSPEQIGWEYVLKLAALVDKIADKLKVNK